VKSRPTAASLVGPALLACASCGWDYLDAIRANTLTSTTGQMDATADGTVGAAGSPDAPGDGNAESDDAPDGQPLGAGGPIDGSSAIEAGDATLPPDANPSAEACSSSQTAARAWNFDTTTEGWVAPAGSGAQTTLVWTGAIGNPNPGSLAADISALDGSNHSTLVQYSGSPALGNLSGRTISAWVMVESSTTQDAKLFVQTTSFAWADNGTIHLAPHVWTCMSLSVSGPSYNTLSPPYDPTMGLRIGIELGVGASPFRLYVDSVRYY
jgi:hypothetical protein